MLRGSKSDAVSPDEMRDAMRKTWVIYHTAGAMAYESQRRGNSAAFSFSILRRIAMDIHHFVVSACPRCLHHHTEYLRQHLPRAIARQHIDYERFVFDLHNAITERTGGTALPDAEFDAVRQHYREQLRSMGPAVSTYSLSMALPTLAGRWCYDCQ